MKILHTCLNVTNLDRSIEFYTKQIGLKFVSRREVKQNNAEIAFLQDENNGALELTYWRDKKSLVEGDNFDHIAFQTDNIDARIKQLRANGVTIAMEPFSLDGSTSKIAFVKDPDGNWLELIQQHR
ncbi:MAG TPA: VOC family protein [Candidatus Acidoferrales bacterium]|nr:VOC family protein [Candidatus Acidoferrales bacterium]